MWSSHSVLRASSGFKGHDDVVGNADRCQVENNREGPYEAFCNQLMARHQHPMTSGLSTVGDALVVLGVLVAAVSRRRGLGAVGVALGVSAAVVAHIFQPGTLKDELAAISSHPLWAAKAETRRVLAR